MNSKIKNVIWAQEHRHELASAMAKVIVEKKIVIRNGRFPFASVFNEAQHQLKYKERGIFRKHYTSLEANKFRVVVKHLIDNIPKPIPAIKNDVPSNLKSPPVTEVNLSLGIGANEHDPMSIVQGFIDSAAKLGTLLISERESRRQIEIKFASQQRLLEVQTHEIAQLRKTVEAIEEFITRPVTKSITTEVKTVSQTQSQTPNVIKKPRVFIIGMDTRNHAFFQNTFGHKMEFHFCTGTKKMTTIKPREQDHVFVVTGFCSHALYNHFMDDMKRRGFKDNIKIINGGMTTISAQLQEIVRTM